MNVSQLEEAARVLQRGDLLIFPTETIYGLGCLATQEDALRRLFDLKGRAPGKPPPVLVADGAQLRSLVAAIPPAAGVLMRQHWPGALTLVLPARDGLSPLLTGVATDGHTRTVGARMTSHPLARALCEIAGAPLVATSANFSGATGPAAAPRTLDEIAPELRAQVKMTLDGGVLGGAPSTVVDCTQDPPRVLRHGAVTMA
jgi:L-threonylcarbamoyladenylate synthase